MSDKFYHQEITFAVLSERELRSSVGLRDLCQAMDDGKCVAILSKQETTELTGKEAALILSAMRIPTERFGLSEDGKRLKLKYNWYQKRQRWFCKATSLEISVSPSVLGGRYDYKEW